MSSNSNNSKRGQRGAKRLITKSVVVAYNGGLMPAMTTNAPTGKEIKENYTNCGQFRVSQWIQEGWLENMSKLQS